MNVITAVPYIDFSGIQCFAPMEAPLDNGRFETVEDYGDGYGDASGGGFGDGGRNSFYEDDYFYGDGNGGGRLAGGGGRFTEESYGFTNSVSHNNISLDSDD